jgi:hypothetical protein
LWNGGQRGSAGGERHGPPDEKFEQKRAPALAQKALTAIKNEVTAQARK